MTITWPPRGKALGGLDAKDYVDAFDQALADAIAVLTSGTGDMRNADNLAFLADFAAARAYLDTPNFAEMDQAILNALADIIIDVGGVQTVNGDAGPDVVIDFSNVGADQLGAAAQALLDAKAYADAIAAGNSPRAACRVATVAALPACTYANGTLGVGATLTANANGALTVDTILLTVDDDVLVKNQVTQGQNGIYTLTQQGSGATPFVLTRRADADESSEVPGGMVTFISDGTAPRKAGTFVQLTPGPITVGTTAQVFDQSGATTAYTASNGIALTGSNFAPTYGTTANTIAQGNDTRFTDARTPLAHKVSHQLGGTDELLLSESQVTNLTADLAGKVATTAIGVTVQGFHANLQAISGLTSAANKGITFTGSGTAATYDLTATALSLLDDTTIGAMRTTLGLGGAAVLNVGTTAGTVAAGDDARFTGVPPTGAAGGVLTGNYPNPTLSSSTLTNIASGWTVASGDLTLPTPTWAAGAITGGVIQRATGLQISATYTQTTDPVDPSAGTPIFIDWNPTLNGSVNAPYGPSSGAPSWGPLGLVTIQGKTLVGANQFVFGFTPIGFADMHKVSNVVGSNRTIVPGWNFMTVRTTFADTNTVTLKPNDIANGTAGFVSNQMFCTAHSGTLDGTNNNYEIIDFLSMPFIQGNSHISKAIGFKVNDLNQYLGTPGTDFSVVSGGPLANWVSGADAGVGIVDEQYGVYIPHLTQAVTSVGVYNGSATVNPGLPVTLSSNSALIPITASRVLCTCTAARTLSSTPCIADGMDGQTIEIVNVGTFTLTLQDEQTLSGSNLLISSAVGAGSVGLSQYDSITIRYSSASGKWEKVARSNPFNTQGAPVIVRDDITSDGAVRLDVRPIFGTPAAAVDVRGNGNDTRAGIRIWVTGGVPSLELGPGGFTDTDVKITRSGTAAVTVEGTFAYTSGLVRVTDGTPADGRVDAAVSALGPAFNVYGASGDTITKAQLINTGLQLGPGATSGGSNHDVKFLRTGTATAAVNATGGVTFDGPLTATAATLSGALIATTGAFSGDLTQTSGSLVMTDGQNGHGRTEVVLGSVGGAINLYTNASVVTDTQVVVGLSEFAGLVFGPGGTTATDVALKRNGTASALFTGVLNLTSPVINTGISGTAVITDAGFAGSSSDTAIPTVLAVKTALAAKIPVLTDPNADRILFWDDSANAYAYLTPGTNLTITGTTIDAASGTPANDSVTNAILANMATATIKGRVTAGTGDPEDLTAAQAISVLGLDADIATLVLPATTTISTFGASLIDDAAASNARTTLGLGAAALLADPVPLANGGTGATTAAGAIAALGLDADLATLVLPASTTISAYGATLIDDANAAAAIATLGLDADIATLALPASTTISAFGATLIDDAAASNARTTLGLILGTDVEVHNANLTTIAGLTATTDNFIVSVASAWASRTPAQVKTTLALNNVDNTSDAGKPVSTAQQTALDLKANLASPTFTGTVVLPGQTVTRAMEVNQAANSFRGNITGSAATAIDMTVAQAKTLLNYVASDFPTLAPLASPTFTGTVVLPAQTVTRAMEVNQAANSFRGNITGSAATAIDMTVAQAKTLLAYTAADLGFDADLSTFALPASTTISAYGATLVDDANAAAAIATLGLDADLATFVVPASTTISAFGATLVDDANAAAALTTLGLDADLATFAVPASTTISTFGATLVDDADATTARTTLGLGTMATATEASYALLAGRSGGQTLAGGTGSAEILTLRGSTISTHGGTIALQSKLYLYTADETVTAVTYGGVMKMDNAYTLNFVNASFGTSNLGVIEISPTIIAQQSMQAAGMCVIRVATDVKNLVGNSVTLQGGSFRTNCTYTADTNTATVASIADYFSVMNFAVANSGTLVTGNDYVNYEGKFVFGTGTAVTGTIGAFTSLAPTGSGTMTNFTAFRAIGHGYGSTSNFGLDIGVLSGAGNNVGVRIAAPSGGTANVGLQNKGTTELGSSAQLTVDTSGNLAGPSVAVTGLLTSSGGASGGIGYAAGAGGTVTQVTSRTTTVVLNELCGTITLFSTTLAADTDVTFTWTNSQIAAADNVMWNIISGAAVKGCYSVNFIPGAGTCTVTVHNQTPTVTATEAPQIRFTVIKGVTT